MKTILIDPATFDGAQFKALYGLTNKDYFVQVNKDETQTLSYPDALVTPTVIFAPMKTQDVKVQEAITATDVTNATEFAKLSDSDKIQKLYDVVNVLAKKVLGISL